MGDAWLERWEEGRIGWHQADGNPSLRQHWRATGRRVLVPLCGKAVDLLWLAQQGHAVVGVELSSTAIRAFFAEQDLDFDIVDGELTLYRAHAVDVSIFCGDYFRLESIQCDAHYDRGALIALPRELRAAYAAHTGALLRPDAEQLVITVEYDEAVAQGPPYSVADDEVLHYWPSLVCVDAYDDIDNAPPKFIDAGLNSMVERVWRTR